MAEKLKARLLPKVWGRHHLPDFLGEKSPGEPIGEIVFEPRGEESPLLVKYLLTSEMLSVQVHPGDEAARRSGHGSGKEEAWLVLEVQEDAQIALGFSEKVDRQRLEEGARSGAIMDWLDWKKVAAGDVYHVPPGTVHAIGAGIVLVEFQQNIDLTYRLYDHGRPRELHLEEGLAVADPGPYLAENSSTLIAPGRERLVAGDHFSVERWSEPGRYCVGSGRNMLVVPLGGTCRIEGEPATPGSAWEGDAPFEVELDAGARLLFACPAGPPVAVERRMRRRQADPPGGG